MQEFKHSVRVPRLYKLSASILKKALTEGASVKTLLFEDKLRHFRTNVLYALISNAIKYNAEIDTLFEKTALLEKEPRLEVWLAKILTVELLFGKKTLPGKSKPELTVASYKEQFEKLSAENPDLAKKEAGAKKPRYVRINTNLLTTSDAIRAFQDESYRFIRCTSGSYDDYLDQVKGLGEYDFMQDYHVKTVFVFAPGTKLHEHELYWENKIILQDKATAMAVQLLAPAPGSVVLDMCAAPGMKTTQLAAYIKNQGTVYAVEQDTERYKTLCDFVEKTGSTCVQTINKDCLEIKRGDYADVEYILLDPSCSGSGMDLCAHSYVEDDRLARLTSLQEKFLKHALNAFPKVKRVVYSTCSIFPQENERVVTNVVNQCRIKWNVLNVKNLLKDQWNNFGTGMYGSMGPRCLYARPDTDLTTGFFMAVLEKDPKYFDDNRRKEADTVDKNGESNKKGKQTKRVYSETSNQLENKSQDGDLNNTTIVLDDNEVVKIPSKKDKKKKKVKEIINQVDDQLQVNFAEKYTEDVTNETNTAQSSKIKKMKIKNQKGENTKDEFEVTIPKRKKNKRKDKHVIESDAPQDKVVGTIKIETEVVDVEVVLKKKKRKKAELDITTESCITNHNEEIVEPKKKKKKKAKHLLED